MAILSLSKYDTTREGFEIYVVHADGHSVVERYLADAEGHTDLWEAFDILETRLRRCIRELPTVKGSLGNLADVHAKWSLRYILEAV
ncbi:MAG: hypothetical protein AAF998_28505 [Bacteroidota bacterium]